MARCFQAKIGESFAIGSNPSLLSSHFVLPEARLFLEEG
jgi:hypothetical protein